MRDARVGVWATADRWPVYSAVDHPVVAARRAVVPVPCERSLQCLDFCARMDVLARLQFRIRTESNEMMLSGVA